MAGLSVFKNANKPSVGNAGFEVVYTCPVGLTSYFINITIASRGAGGTVSVRIWDDANGYYIYIVDRAAVPAGSSLPCLIESNKLVLQENDRLEVKSESPGIVFDVHSSLLEDVNV